VPAQRALRNRTRTDKYLADGRIMATPTDSSAEIHLMQRKCGEEACKTCLSVVKPPDR